MRKLKQKSKRLRRLTEREFDTLALIWKWKLLSKNAIRLAIYPKCSDWWFYKSIRRLVQEGYLVERLEGKLLDASFYQLSKKGFEHVSHDLPELIEKRFAAQSVTHDAMTSAFHLGEYVQGLPEGVTLLSEQELQCFDPSLYPLGVPRTREHIPDGYTIIQTADARTVLAFEVEVSAKGAARYDKVGLHFDLNRDVEVVFWLVGDVSVFSIISRRLLEIKTRRSHIHNFVTLEQFKKDGWQSKIIFGSHLNQTIFEVMTAKAQQIRGNTEAKPGQKNLAEIFFQNAKSPVRRSS